MSPTDTLYNLRHSLAHVLAQAVTRLWPGTLITIGPPVDDGCYYDFLFSEPISDVDFPKIEKEMKKIIHQGQTFRCDTLTVTAAKKYWRSKKQKFKVELIEDLEKKEKVKEVTHYVNIGPKGEETFVDLCRGGHVENLREIPVDCFKITSLAAAYWRGDEKRESLTRVYLTAFATKDDLDRHLLMIEEAKRRDHRVLGTQLDLFVFSDRVGSGLPLFLPKGEIVKYELERYMREEKTKLGYSFVCIPHIAKKELYEKSGHMGKYDAMMPPLIDKEGNQFVVKPMNCPHHFELYTSRQHSYRELPLRFAENTTCYRNEKSGELSGLTRVKALTQDDTHHFVRHDQIESEISMILGLMERTYKTFGFEKFTVEVSIRDPHNPSKYFGDDKLWSSAESILIAAVKHWGVPYVIKEGEAAFYGPKIDIRVNDAIGRDWQLTTVQLDFVQPENFNMTYVGQDGAQHRPAVLHVAILGSSHRFMGVVIEHFAGLFPLWLAPVQVALVPVAAVHDAYARTLDATLRSSGVRTLYLSHEESLGKRIREGETQKIPYLLVIGDREVESSTVTVRNVKTKKQVTVAQQEFIDKTIADIRDRRLQAAIG